VIIAGKTREGVYAYYSPTRINESNYIKMNVKHINVTRGFSPIYQLVQQIFYTGKRWECVEFARRFLLVTKAITFDDVDCATDIWRLDYFTHIQAQRPVELQKIWKVWAQQRFLVPEKNDVLIWERDREQPYGHVAIVVGRDGDDIHIAEQNYEDDPHKVSWKGRPYARTITLANEPFLIGWLRIE
jgi:glutathionylspermidine amidase/synthetase